MPLLKGPKDRPALYLYANPQALDNLIDRNSRNLSAIKLLGSTKILLASHTNMMEKDRNVVVVGAGVFGLTTALELTLQGYRNVIVLDRNVPPVRIEEKGGRSL